MAYPYIYMELPDGILIKEGDQKDHVLKLLANLYALTNSSNSTSNNFKLTIVSFFVRT
jgi:hypothetical protein